MEHLDTLPTKAVELQTLGLSEAPQDIPIDRELERNAVRKLDYTIIPIMGLYYFLSFLVSYLFCCPS